MFKKTIYLSVLFLIIGVIISLPIVTVPISSSARGVIRSQTENTKIVSVVGGRVIENKLEKNNQEIKQGETLLIITAEQLDTQKSLQSSQILDYQAQLQDLNKLTRGQYSGLQTGQYQRELSAMQEKIAQVKVQLELAKKDYNRALSLYNQGVIPKAEYDKFYYDYQGFLTQISSIREQQLAQWQAQKEKWRDSSVP
ncbi:HlyD family secretion protein [Riemerella anatipestifer]|nr:HlyD family secretion protein [Riemerella anatipestifer]